MMNSKFVIPILLVISTLGGFVAWWSISYQESAKINACGELVPVSTPIVFNEVNQTFLCDFIVSEWAGYSIEFKYHAKIHPDLEEVRRIRRTAGGEESQSPTITVNNGGPMEVFYELKGPRDEVLKSGEVKNPKIYSWGGGTFSASILGVPLDPGKYQIKITNLKSVAEMDTIETSLAVRKRVIK